MSRYAPLVTVVVRHGYYGEDPCRAVDLTLSPSSAERARRAGLLVRSRPGTLVILHDLEARDRLQLHLSDPSDPLHLDLGVGAREPLLSESTDPIPSRSDAILVFDSRESSRDPEGKGWRLSREEWVSETDFVPMDSEVAASWFSVRRLRKRPLALVRIHLAGEDGGLLDPDPGTEGILYRLDFRARETYWRYLLLGSLTNRSPLITDLDKEAQFEFRGEETLPGDRKALAFQSTTRIPLRERSDRRFQLHLEGSNGSPKGATLIERLPVATPAGIHRDTIDGKSVFVSDIFVNG
ncbi:MAG: hypothetical protein EA421_09480 [Gemmatimonadales bacterium]|nr:MAG: hypothetical protein EA421_09480 [Gemmatimonadales bacterium]